MEAFQDDDNGSNDDHDDDKLSLSTTADDDSSSHPNNKLMLFSNPEDAEFESSNSINSMSAIYSQDEEKMIEQLLTKDILKDGNNILDDFKHSGVVGGVSRGGDVDDDDSVLTGDTAIDIHYLSGCHFLLYENKMEIGDDTRPTPPEHHAHHGHSNNARDCNYGNTLENAYEEFGIERQLIPTKQQPTTGSKLRGTSHFAVILPPLRPHMANKFSNSSSRRPFSLSNPVDVDELSTGATSLRSNVSKSSFKTARSKDGSEDRENAMVELVKLDNFKWLIDCGTEWDCISDDDENYTTSRRGGCGATHDPRGESSQKNHALDEMEAARRAFQTWDDDIDKSNFDKILDVMDYAINGKACELFEEYYDDQYEIDDDLKTVDGGKTVDLEYDDDDGISAVLRKGEENEEDCNSQKTTRSRRQRRRRQQPPKEAVANTDAIRMQQVVFVSPNVGDPSSTMGFLA
mmetsp:Transcript_8668/g.15312  ORF Transcript_8668/g.15312 Transcript_8668/m.15312 type:complete len:460 (-) Transcript_8668:7-1386(-)